MEMTKTAKSETLHDGGDDDDDVSRQTLGIGDDLFTEEILPRIPVKHLIRSKLVSKKWNSIISSPEFAKLHLKFSHANTLNRNFIIDPRIHNLGGDKKRESYLLLPYTERINLTDDVVLLDQVTDFRRNDLHSVQMVDSCNGLVCLCQQYVGDNDSNKLCFFTLWNPATGEYRDIASPEGVHVSKAHGFGYVPSVDDYFIVASFGTGVFCGDTTFRGFYVWSLKTGEWERILGRFDYLESTRKWESVRHSTDEKRVAERLYGVGIMVGDAMFWASYEVVGFDIVRKGFKVYPWLDWQNGYRFGKMFRVKGCLVLLFSSWNRNNAFDFWMLKNPTVWCSFSSWEKILSADLRNISLLTISETGKCLVRQHDEFRMVELCKEALESARNSDGIYRGHVIAKDHVESFVSPFGIIMVDENEDTSGQ